MSQPEQEPRPVTFNVTFADASNLPIHHVNIMNLRRSSDEFFFTLGVVQPPDQSEMEAIMEDSYIVAQPVVRFAISRGTMEQFLTLMAGQFDEQTTFIKRLHSSDEETYEEEVSKDE